MVDDRPDIQVLKQTPLWVKFVEKTSQNPDLIAKVESLVKYAGELLERIIETFPTYTIHNGIHQINIVRIMGNLIGDQIDNLTSLECAFLLLSSYYHDIGMVFTLAEKNDLRNEPEFELFLKIFPDAYIEFKEKNELTDKIAEWYCRWSHAKRVHRFLIEIGDEKLRWGTISLREKLGDLCESHNWEIEKLKEDDKLNTSFLDDADLKFCSIILRLADILDFDRSRSPESIYKFLNLEKRETSRIKESDIEWKKHLSSQGFKFPLDENNELKIIAGPDNPAVEHDVREFLNVIDAELNNCRNLLKFCDNRWKNIKLPEKINRTNIIGQGYKYGNFRFSLDQEKILELLMGENLYENQNTFIRELLQNSIDTSRYRVFHEHANGNINFKVKPIKLSDWTDKDGYNWIRIDDFGMGMNENKIINYLLRVGNSYYNSSEFKVDKLLYKEKLKEDFTPISRFGIGILSCFIAGDRVEVNTKPLLKTDIENIRLTIEGLHNFYIMQSGNDIPSFMPNAFNQTEGYRIDYGTSIAVRLDPKKEFRKINLEEVLIDKIYASEIDIIYNEKKINNHTLEEIKKPFITYHKEFLKNEEKDKINNFLEDNIGNEITIELIPLDLTSHSESKYLMGQLILVNLNIPEKYKNEYPPNSHIGLNDHFNLQIRKRIMGTDRDEYLDIPISRLRDKVSPFVKYKKADEYYFIKSLCLSHNGIIVPTEKIARFGNNDHNYSFNDHIFENQGDRRHRFIHTFLLGSIVLKDKLRPNVSTSRDQIKPFAWDILSNISLTFIKTFQDSTYCSEIKLNSVEVLEDYLDYNRISLATILKDELIDKIDGWRAQKIFNLKGYKKSINDINELLKSGEIIFYDVLFHGSFHSLLINSLLKINYDISLRKQDNLEVMVIKSLRTKPISEGIKLFYPNEFIEYENMGYLKCNSRPINENHKFSEWFLRNSLVLNEKYPGMFSMIRNLLNNINSFYFLVNTNDKILLDLNKTLERLRELNDKDLDIPQDLKITNDDIFHTKPLSMK